MTELDPYRLPRHTVPGRYDIVLEPDLEAATFRGQETIFVETVEAADQVVLNAADLEIDSCRVDGDEVGFRLNAAAERLHLDVALDPGPHTIEIGFRGVLNDQLRGWYRSTYTDVEGVERVIATSQMESVDARRAFPCWDEPDFKAVFAISLIVEDGLLAVSNGAEVERVEEGDGRVRVRFAETMPMSSYLVALIVGPLAATEWVDVDGIPVRIVHVPGKEELTGFGMEVAAFCLRWFQEYYGIPYPGDKMDLAALPDFAAGAMENLGCVTFRENLLLVDPENATQRELRVIADVIAHELAHMWFGDLVTMRWWNGIWLNEAFATFMEMAACDAFRPSWRRWTAFGLERTSAFEVDALTTTRSVEYHVEAPADCEGMFDVLTYEKGASLLRMLEQHLGPDVFRDGVRHYLDRHRYGNTATSDLWDALEESSGQPVRQIMDTWIWQPGFPLVSARLDGDEVELTQRRFSFTEADDTIWQIPVAVGVDGRVERIVLGDKPVRLSAGDGAVIVNAGGEGYFRVAYDEALRGRLTAEVIAGLATLERYALVDDAWAAVVAGDLTPLAYLDLVEQFGAERQPEVWRSIGQGLRSVRRLVTGDEAAERGLARRVADLVRPALDDLGDPSDGDDEQTLQLRGLLLELAATVGDDADATARGRELYGRWAAGEHVDPDLAAAATRIVAAGGDDADFERFVDLARTGATPQVQLRHLYALAEFPERAQIERTVELAFTDDIKTQNAPFVLAAAIGHRHHGVMAWEAVRDRWDQVNERFPRNTIHRTIQPVTTLDRPDQVADVQAFFADHPIEQAALQLAQILERQRVNAALRERAADETVAALK